MAYKEVVRSQDETRSRGKKDVVVKSIAALFLYRRLGEKGLSALEELEYDCLRGFRQEFVEGGLVMEDI